MNILDNINENINPCDDFYNYATGNWIKNNPQPDEYPTWNVFTKIEEDNIERIRDIITSSKTDSSVINHKINDCYNIIMNYDKRNKDGKKPLISYIDEHVNNLKTNMDVILESARNNIEMFLIQDYSQIVRDQVNMKLLYIREDQDQEIRITI